jgi:hypothetical protein
VSVLGCLALLLVAGCTKEFPAYPQSQACGVPTHLVVGVVGTDHFRLEQSSDLPLGSSSGFRCEADLGNRRGALSVQVTMTSFDRVTAYRRSIEASDRQFATAGGIAGLSSDRGSFAARWLCSTPEKDGGTMRGYATGRAPKGTTDTDREDLVKAIAAAARCGSKIG